MTQETKLKSIGRYSIEYGTIGGIAGIIWGLILMYLDIHYQNSVLSTIVSSLISITVLTYGLVTFRKEYGFLNVGQCIKIGLGIGAVSGIIASIYFLALINYIDPDFTEKTISYSVETYAQKNPNASQEQLDQVRIGQEYGRKPLFAIAAILIITVIFYFLIALISAIFLKKSK